MGDYKDYKVCQVLDKQDFRVVILREHYQPIIISEISMDSNNHFYHTPKNKSDILDFAYMIVPRKIKEVDNISIGNWATFLGGEEIHVDTHPRNIMIPIRKIDSSCFFEVTFSNYEGILSKLVLKI